MGIVDSTSKVGSRDKNCTPDVNIVLKSLAFSAYCTNKTYCLCFAQ